MAARATSGSNILVNQFLLVQEDANLSYPNLGWASAFFWPLLKLDWCYSDALHELLEVKKFNGFIEPIYVPV